jgi:hypothetical protein
MDQQYVAHMTEERFGCIVQLVDHSADTRRSDFSFVRSFTLLRFITKSLKSSFFFRHIHLGYYQLQLILNLIILNVTMIHQHFIHSIIFLFHHHQIYPMNYVHQNDVQLFKHLQTIPLQLFHHQQIILHIHLLVLMMDFVVHQIHLILQFQVEIIIYYHPIDNHI